MEGSNLTTQERIRHEEAASSVLAKLDTSTSRWEAINKDYQRNVFVDQPDSEAQQLRTWLKGEIEDKKILPMNNEEFDHCINQWSDERSKGNVFLITFVNKAADKFKAGAKANNKYLETDTGKKWLVEASQFVMDPSSSVLSKLQPSKELLNFVAPILQEIGNTADFTIGTIIIGLSVASKYPDEPDLDQFCCIVGFSGCIGLSSQVE